MWTYLQVTEVTKALTGLVICVCHLSSVQSFLLLCLGFSIIIALVLSGDYRN